MFLPAAGGAYRSQPHLSLYWTPRSARSTVGEPPPAITELSPADILPPFAARNAMASHVKYSINRATHPVRRCPRTGVPYDGDHPVNYLP